MEKIYLSAPHQNGKELDFLKETLDSNWVAPLGPQVDKFEEEICQKLGVKHAIAMNSGTSAIHIALIMLGVQPGDSVICSSLTFIGSANPILYTGAVPVFVDSSSHDWNICPEALEIALVQAKKKNKLPKAVIAVDLLGHPCRFNEISTLCKRYNVPLIEDSAESLGSLYQNIHCGSFGEFGILSFNGNKIITSAGGGMLITHNSEYAEKAKFLITQARDKQQWYEHSVVGYNYRMSSLSAAVGRAQLSNLEQRVKMRRKRFDYYKNLLAPFDFVKFAPQAIDCHANCWLSAITIESKNINIGKIINELNQLSIECRHIWKPLHMQPLFKGTEFHTTYKNLSFAEEIFEKAICLPSGTNLSNDQLVYLSENLTRIFKQYI